ncbi:hypothetical protein MKK55_11510 [Methylobacterium sp. J-059]|uniref:hypothetical protein n=1 Tax=Methylobacterium sp. J-059 TaxID=2836643 RepID=UPI001FBA91AC|nr:hypothetical protein [Methylobacterium sp. J-059]MCJ2039563.1 hypothetical protein [Methylobacterium sp. J-059]
MALMVNLPGAVAGGVEICTATGHRCIQTPADAETPVQVVSYRDGEGEAVVMYHGERYVAQTNHVSVMFKGCNASLASYVQNKMCPGVRR